MAGSSISSSPRPPRSTAIRTRAGRRAGADHSDVALRLVQADDARSCCATPRAAHGLRYAILRYFNVAGADPQHAHRPDRRPGATHLIKVAVQTALGLRAEAGRVWHRLSDAGRHLHPRLHPCQRSGRARIRSRSRICARGGRSVTFNCGYGHGYSVLEVIEAVKRVSGRNFAVSHADRRPGDPAAIVADRPSDRNPRSAGRRASTISTPSSRTRWRWNAIGGRRRAQARHARLTAGSSGLLRLE